MPRQDKYHRGDRTRPQRLGDRDWREEDAPFEGERYGPAPPEGYGAEFDIDPEIRYGGPGFGGGGGFGGHRFDRLDVGSVGSHGVHPVASPFGPAYSFGPNYGGMPRSRAMRRRDPFYAEWRRRRIEELDRDYEDYVSENQSRFDREFGAWRERRGEQRNALGRATEHMEVVGSDGQHVGKVAKVRGDAIVLTRSDPAAGGVHHAIPCGWVENVDDKVVLNLTAEEAFARWREDDRGRALFERERRGDRGPHMLNRSFAGTYPDDE
jgi:hypothetical protein